MLTSFSFSLSIIYSISQSKHVLSIFWVSMCENLDAHIFPFRQSSIFSNMMVFLHLSLIWNLPLVLSLTMSLCSFCIPCTSGGGFDNFYSLCSSFKISSSLFIIVSMGKLLNLVFYRFCLCLIWCVKYLFSAVIFDLFLSGDSTGIPISLIEVSLDITIFYTYVTLTKVTILTLFL